MNKTARVAVVSAGLILSTILSFFIVEGALRLKNLSMKNYEIEMWKYSMTLKTPSPDPRLGHEHLKNKEAILQSTLIRLNNRGLRGGPVETKPGGRRIIFLGGSITLGWGVPEEATISSRIAEYFRNDGHLVETLNAGTGNYNAERYVELFLTRLTDLEPTDIVVHYFIRDAEVLEAGGGNALLRNSQAAVTVWSLIHRYFDPTGMDTLENHYRKVYEPGAPGLAVMQSSLTRLAEYAKGKGIRLYLAMTPDVHNLVNYKFGYIHQLVGEFAKSQGYVYVDLFPAFQGITPEKIWAMPGDPHPNALGHELMAKALYPALKDVPPTTALAHLQPGVD